MTWGELGILKQRPSYRTAGSPGLLLLPSHEDPFWSSCRGRLGGGFVHSDIVFPHLAALSESTVTRLRKAIVWSHIWKAQDSSSLGSRVGPDPRPGEGLWISKCPVEDSFG